jgi:hypothetical protein
MLVKENALCCAVANCFAAAESARFSSDSLKSSGEPAVLSATRQRLSARRDAQRSGVGILKNFSRNAGDTFVGGIGGSIPKMDPPLSRRRALSGSDVASLGFESVKLSFPVFIAPAFVGWGGPIKDRAALAGLENQL